MKPASYPIELVRGDDYDLELTFKTPTGAVIPLTGRTYRAQVRRLPTDDELLATFTVDTARLADGVVVLRLPKTVTATLPRTAVWDCEETGTDSKVRTILAGPMNVIHEVTR